MPNHGLCKYLIQPSIANPGVLLSLSTNVFSFTLTRLYPFPVIVSGTLYQTLVVLVNVYAPNWHNPNFMTSLFSKIPNLDTHRLILGGDLNLVIDPKLDRSHPKVLTPSAMSKTLSSIMIGCIDVWHLLHPFSKEFSYFSKVHQAYSRINYFFIDRALLPTVKSTEYSAVVISDHAPHILDLALLPNTSKQWKFNMGLLAKDEFCDYIYIKKKD